MSRLLQLSLLGVLLQVAAYATPCPSQTLQFYRQEFNDGASCSNGTLNFFNFTFAKISTAGTVTAEDIIVKASANGIGLDFAGNPDSPFGLDAQGLPAVFNRSVTEREQYFISYIVDPPPVIAGDELLLDPPTGPFYVTRLTCPDDIFDQKIDRNIIRGQAVTTYQTLYQCLKEDSRTPFQVQATSATGLSADLSDSVAYPELANFVHVRMIIDLFPGEHTGLEAIVTGTTVVPEPGAFLPLAAGVAGLIVVLRRRKVLKS